MSGLVDREKTALWSFGVQVTDQGTPPRFIVVLVLITVVDTNDNPPIFPTETLNVSFSESSPQLSTVTTVQAVDILDVGDNRVIFYSIQSITAVPFGINRDNGVIYLNGSIDYEAVRYYVFTVYANDDGLDTLNDTLVVRVNIINENDNTPQFERPTYTHFLSENASIGDALQINITATDRDSTLTVSVKLTYFITGGADNRFSINPETSVVSVAGELDRETIPEYLIDLEVRDSARTGYATLRVILVDVNEAGPVFNASSYIGYVREDAFIGRFVITIQATDQEFFNPINFILTEDGNGDFRIVSNISTPSLPFGTRAFLLVNNSLDRETRDVYELSITAIDSDDRRSVAPVTVNLIDVNDNNPLFEENPSETAVVIFESICVQYNSTSNMSCYYIQIQESASPGLILTVFTSDRDIGDNALSLYSISSHNDSMFRIDPSVGQLFNDLAFNHETEHLHILTVIATNIGSPQLTARTLVVVDVLDANDNKPVFDQGVYYFAVYENNALDTTDPIMKFIGTAEAVDIDDGRNGELSYQFISGNFGDAFTITDGVITVTDSLDRESLSNSIFDLILQATDGNQNQQQTGTARVVITVLDINDNIPTFQQPEYVVTIEEEFPVWSNIPIPGLTASDPDLSANGTLYYSLSDITFFNVTPTGQIYPVRRLDYDTITQVLSRSIYSYLYTRIIAQRDVEIYLLTLIMNHCSSLCIVTYDSIISIFSSYKTLSS